MKLLIYRALALLGLVPVLVIGWVALAPEPPCAEPTCAQLRYRLVVEADSLNGAGVVPLGALERGGTLTLQGLFESGGIDVDVIRDDLQLPDDRRVHKRGPIEVGSLTATRECMRSVSRSCGAWTVSRSSASSSITRFAKPSLSHHRRPAGPVRGSALGSCPRRSRLLESLLVGSTAWSVIQLAEGPMALVK